MIFTAFLLLMVVLVDIVAIWIKIDEEVRIRGLLGLPFRKTVRIE